MNPSKPKERIQECTVGEIPDVSVPQVMEQTIGVVKDIPHEHVNIFVKNHK